MHPRNTKDVFALLGQEFKDYKDVDCRVNSMPKDEKNWIIQIETLLMLLNQSQDKNAIFLKICDFYLGQIHPLASIDKRLINRLTNSLYDFMRPEPVRVEPVMRRGGGLRRYLVPASELEVKEQSLAAQMTWLKQQDINIKKAMENVHTAAPTLLPPLINIIEECIADPKEQPRFWR